MDVAPFAVDQFFDYASFMWENGDLWQNTMSPESVESLYPNASSHWPQNIPDSSRSIPETDHGDQDPTRVPLADGANIDQALMGYFVRTVVPPILAQVETQQKWSSMRQTLISMSEGSSMVRLSILAFSDLLLWRREGTWQRRLRNYYNEAAAELSKPEDITGVTPNSKYRGELLAAIFFLSYCDILEGRIKKVHMHLKKAHSLFRHGLQKGFRPVEIRLLCWIRLLDARAVSAGGEGLFLSDNEEELLVEASPAGLETDNGGRTEDVQEADIEEALFQVLYQPGIAFFQKVQSFMGRISKIDPWHRQRGTVEDETEVMIIAASISKDLHGLYQSRPLLMDFAVLGKLTATHVSETLASTITRAFRTYLSNYHASKVHLHRVAYKHLPLTTDTADALTAIRHLTTLMVDGLEEEEALPVNMLWPLLMLGAEEKDPAQRTWIKDTILRMEKVATNAKITAQVLEEVQARQDASHARVDIRSVMHDTFDSCFAIV